MKLMLVEEDVDPQMIEHEVMLRIYDEAARRALVAMDVEHELKLGQRYSVTEDGKTNLVWEVHNINGLQ